MVPDNKDCRVSIWIRHPMQQQCKTHHILSGLSEAYPVDSGQGSVRPCVLCPFLGFGVFVSVGVWSVLVVGLVDSGVGFGSLGQLWPWSDVRACWAVPCPFVLSRFFLWVLVGGLGLGQGVFGLGCGRFG